MQNRIYIKFKIEEQIDDYTSLHKRRIYNSTGVEGSRVQGSVILIILKKVLRFLDVLSVSR